MTFLQLRSVNFFFLSRSLGLYDERSEQRWLGHFPFSYLIFYTGLYNCTQSPQIDRIALKRDIIYWLQISPLPYKRDASAALITFAIKDVAVGVSRNCKEHFAGIRRHRRVQHNLRPKFNDLAHRAYERRQGCKGSFAVPAGCFIAESFNAYWRNLHVY